MQSKRVDGQVRLALFSSQPDLQLAMEGNVMASMQWCNYALSMLGRDLRGEFHVWRQQQLLPEIYSYINNEYTSCQTAAMCTTWL